MITMTRGARLAAISLLLSLHMEPTRGMAPPLSPNGVAVVTGGSRGIGAACCRALASRGYGVVIVYQSDSRAAEIVKAEITNCGGQALAVQADVGDEAQVSHLFTAVDQWRGECPLRVLVNNAGMIGQTNKQSLQEATSDELTEMMRVNVVGPFNCLKQAERRMTNSGGGAVVQISSGSAYLGTPLLYAASKGALNSMTIGLVAPLAKQGIRINTVSPGMTATDMVADVLPTFDMSKIPLGRAGTPDEIANVVCWLCSDEASYVAGANVRVSGGRPPGTTLG